MPVHTTRATRIDATANANPPSARGAKPNNPTSSANPACNPTMRLMRARPCARFAHTKLTTFESAGAPVTNATARLTSHGSAACANVFLMSTAAVAPSTRPSVRPNKAQGAISRLNAASAASDSAGLPRSAIDPTRSTKALPYQTIQRTNRVRVSAEWPPRALLGIPGVHIAVQPVARARDEAFEQQCGDDRSGELCGRHII